MSLFRLKYFVLYSLFIGFSFGGNAQSVLLGSSIEGLGTGDHAGSSIALDSTGHTVALGMMDNTTGKGCAGVYTWNGTTWNQKGATIFGEIASEQCGRSVALSADGSIFAVGSQWYQSGTGKVRVFKWNGSDWTQMGATLTGSETYGQYGISISLSNDGKTLVVGCISNDGGSNGRTRIYGWNGTNWVQKGGNIDGLAPTESSGVAVRISANGNSVVIGASMGGVNFNYAGRTRVYDWDGTAWVKRGLDIVGEADQDQSGNAVDISDDGNVIIIGAYKNNSDIGQARAYEWNGTEWIQRGGDMEGEIDNEWMGTSVAISGDGKTVVVGATHNHNANGNDAGTIRIYDWDGTNWVKRDENLNGGGTNFQRGWSVDVSENGNIIACGDWYYTNVFYQQGAGTIYRYCHIDNSTTKEGMTITVSEEYATYQWIDCDNNNLPIEGATGKSFTASSNGHYAVIITQDECIDTSACVEINTAEISKLTNIPFSLYPNPTSGTFNVNLGEKHEFVKIKIFNNTGQVLLERSYSNTEMFEIDSPLSNGLYFVEIMTETGEKSKLQFQVLK